jgi:hypothetical protein
VATTSAAEGRRDERVAQWQEQVDAMADPETIERN